MSSQRPPIETIRVISLKKVWSSWGVFDSGGQWVWGKEDAMGLSDVRMERVVRVRAAIANGHYHVSSEDLAQKLISNMLVSHR